MGNRKLIVGNLKSYMNVSDVKNYIRIIDKKINSKNVVICPTSMYIPYFINRDFSIGVQNIMYDDNKVYTGETTCNQIRSMGIKYAIVGHAERRISFNEDDMTINKKVIDLLKNKISVVLCIGETEEQKNRSKTNEVLKRQIRNCLKGITNTKNIFIAYEPVWAIGTNKVLNKQDIGAIADYIKNIAYNMYELDVKVLYGGSVNKNNIKELININEIDGFLIGKSSTEANEFLKIIEVIENQ